MNRADELVLLEILDNLAGVVRDLSDKVDNLIAIARLLDERVTQLESSK